MWKKIVKVQKLKFKTLTALTYKTILEKNNNKNAFQ